MSNEHIDGAYPKLDLIELLHGLRRSARHLLIHGIVLILAAAVAMGALTHYRYSPVYKASASFTVKVTNPLYADQYYYNSSAAEQMAKTFPHILTSGILSEKVKSTLGISYMPSVSAAAMGSTNVITLTVTSSDPELAYDVLNCVIEVYPSVAEFVVGPTALTLLSESGVPTTPVNAPNYLKSAITGAFMGAVVWAGLALLYWMTHKTINSEEELGKLVNLPCLGRLPMMRGFSRKKGRCPLISDRNDKFGFSESVRLLRVRVEKAMDKEKGNILMVTSTIPDEGKTTVSVNLATALAQKGKRTLLVDCDLRNPSVAGIFNTSVRYGVSEFLKGECTLNDTLHKMSGEDLYVVFGGAPTGNPEKLLANKNIELFMKAARDTFDYIILDTPPCALLADAAEIGTLADGILLTVRQDFVCRGQIMEGVQLLDDCGKPIIGCVLNMAAQQSSKGGIYSSYGYDRHSGVEAEA
ncbi:MAG: polysaccharide biosynthesis tyrosine autokinase [Clostridia bacterium]|nr:polysaccharide biosynthesis tyrosine autokinase [Clostridia bacterium]